MATALHDWKPEEAGSAMRRRMACLLITAISLALVGCQAKAGDSTVDRATVASPSEQLVPLDASGSGSLEGVGIGPSGPYGFAPGTPEDRSNQRGLERLEVRVFDTLGGIETKLVVPMYYDKSTTYRLRIGQTEPVPLWSAIASDTVTWWGTPGADVTFHESDGVLVLDSLVSNLAH